MVVTTNGWHVVVMTSVDQLLQMLEWNPIHLGVMN